ncbi:GNAT family N-acetyltransferase [Paraburkholderia sediminicola]|uniref:GNAT family N-acetyltransferase n=1 Tax=Paraburkholderia sediminicola TaxID=458836 RepID=UPI0038B8848A
MPPVIRQCTFDELASAAGFDVLCAEYAAESGRLGLGAANVDPAFYRALESSGGAILGTWCDDSLIGFGALTLSVLPNFSQLIGCLTAIFITASARKTGAGTAIRQAAEQIARERGAVGMMISAPSESRLDVILQRSSYRATHHVYFKGFQ